MADATPEVMFEVLKSLQARLALVRHEGRLDRIEQRLELNDARIP
jgi:hypothetical protein